MDVELVAIGSELLLGQIVDTNSAWMAQRLAGVGANLFYKTTVGDNLERITATLAKALSRSDCVITGGGLGPTEDDLTREAVAAATGRRLLRDPTAAADLEERFRSRGFVLTANNEKQALIPEGASLVRNPNGTAPAFIVDDGSRVIACLPGVPFEMKWLLDNEILPFVGRRFELSQTIVHRVLKVGELGESAVDDRLGDLIRSAENPRLGLLARPGQVDVRISARAADAAAAAILISPLEAAVRERLGDTIFATDDQTLESVIGQLLRSRGATLACVEDASGGAVCAALSQAAGELFREGRVLSPEALAGQLGGDQVPAEGEVAATRLADLVRTQSGASLGLAVHSRPDADQEEVNLGKGDTWVAVAGAGDFPVRHVRSAGRAGVNRIRAAMHALSTLRRALL